jgi:hypothetical protein
MNKLVFDSQSFQGKLARGLDLSFERLVLKKRQEDGELIFSQNGQIVRVKARDIVLPSEAPKQAE